MSTLRQLTRSSFENGGSVTRSWRTNTQRSRTSRLIREPPPARWKKPGSRPPPARARKHRGEPLLADLRGDRLRVLPQSCAFDRTFAQVAAEQLERPAA